MQVKHTFFLLLLTLLSLPLFAQKKNESFEYHIHKSTVPIQIDGLPNETVWQEAELATNFYRVLPMDTGRAVVRTEVRMLYDEQKIYLLAVNYDKLSGPYIVESLRRDFSFNKNDNFLLFMDTFDDQTNGFTFGTNAEGAQWDGLMFNGNNVDLSWDNKWESAVTNTDDVWIVEMAIPFKTIRYKKGITRWGINFSRLDLKTTEKSAWAPVPRQFPTSTLAYSGVLVWDEPPPAAGGNVSIIPYVLGGVVKNYEKNKEAAYRKEIGGDAKVAITSSLNLDLTVNPDFSQVEVDQQQTNLDRFELFFPERRQFFLENGDLFANFGYSSIRPFFSRRIGLNAPIRYGARLSGKLNKDWRIGIMNMQTGESEDGTPAQNFGIVALQRQVFARSNITAMFINKETFNYESLTDKQGISKYNRNLGLEYNLASANNMWTGKAFYLKSFSPNEGDDNQVLAGDLAYNSKHWNAGIQYEYVGADYRAEVGFVRRRGYHSLQPGFGRLFFPKSNFILSHGPQFFSTFYFDKKFNSVDTEAGMFYSVNFLDRSEFSIWTAYNYVKLLSPFDPTNFVGDTLAIGTEHHWRSWGTEFVSKPQSLFTYSFATRYGGYYADGKRLRLNGEIGYRFQPYVAIALSANYNHINFYDAEVLPENLQHRSFDFWLFGPRLDVTLTNKLYLTNFLQYNNQAENMNLNIRLQWRYSPASDLFLVYTDNYFSDGFNVRNRALVFKLTYWWNV